MAAGRGRRFAAAGCDAVVAVVRPDAPAAVLVLPADMPWVSAETVRHIVETARDETGGDSASRIVVPVLPDGRRGHPVSFGAGHLPALARLTGDRGARVLLDAHPLRTITVADAGILRDVDMPSDLPPS